LFKGLSETFAGLATTTKDERAATYFQGLSRIYAGHAGSPGHGSGWLVVDRNSAFVVTNRHVAEQADYVTLESGNRAYRPIEGCKVLYVDPHNDLAIIEVKPDQLPADLVGFEVSESPVTEGVEVAAVGFPGVGAKPVFQYTIGIVNNA